MSTTPAWWPEGHPEGPYFLIDGWPDDGLDERASVPAEAVRGDEYADVRAQGGLQAACVEFIRRCPAGDGEETLSILEGAGMTLVLADRTRWHRPLATSVAGEYVAIEPEPCEDCDGKGTRHDEADGDIECEECDGTGKYRQTYDNGCPWKVCEPGDPDAVEFYEMEVTDVADVA